MERKSSWLTIALSLGLLAAGPVALAEEDSDELEMTIDVFADSEDADGMTLVLEEDSEEETGGDIGDVDDSDVDDGNVDDGNFGDLSGPDSEEFEDGDSDSDDFGLEGENDEAAESEEMEDGSEGDEGSGEA